MYKQSVISLLCATTWSLGAIASTEIDRECHFRNCIDKLHSLHSFHKVTDKAQFKEFGEHVRESYLKRDMDTIKRAADFIFDFSLEWHDIRGNYLDTILEMVVDAALTMTQEEVIRLQGILLTPLPKLTSRDLDDLKRLTHTPSAISVLSKFLPPLSEVKARKNEGSQFGEEAGGQWNQELHLYFYNLQHGLHSTPEAAETSWRKIWRGEGNLVVFESQDLVREIVCADYS